MSSVQPAEVSLTPSLTAIHICPTLLPAEELPIRLAHRVKELDELPNGLNKMPSIVRVKDWYAQSFEELVTFPKPRLPKSIAAKFPSNPSSAPSTSASDPNGSGGGEGSGSNGKMVMDRTTTTNPVFDEMASMEDGAEEGEVAGRGASCATVSANGGNGSWTKKRVPLANR